MIVDMSYKTSGILKLSSIFVVPRIPPIISEWSALLPLVCHLTSYEEDHQLVGDLALTGFLTIDLFPKLGYLNSVRRLLDEGSAFFDRVNSISGSAHTVWDVQWGSVFYRSNGAATSMIAQHALNKNAEIIRLPESTATESATLDASVSWSCQADKSGDSPQSTPTPSFRRYQTLHVINLGRMNREESTKRRLRSAYLSKAGEIIGLVALVTLAIILCFLGAYGTASLVVAGVTSKILARTVSLQRPPGYLDNNEAHAASMLSAVNGNSSSWYLYTGDRGIVDWLINKPMLTTPRKHKSIIAYFYAAHMFQLIMMTFVAAQKGIDSVSLVMVMLANRAFVWIYRDRNIVKRWLEAEDVAVSATTFEFTGRTSMLGAIHVLSEASNASWMDQLLAPSARRKVWLDELKRTAATRKKSNEDLALLTPSDRSWVLLHSQLAIGAARVMLHRLTSRA